MIPFYQMNKKDIKRILLHIPNTINCGIHSGIPVCCVQYYVSKRLWMTDKDLLDDNDGIQKLAGDLYSTIHYIPCPKCLNNKRIVKTNKCPSGTHCWHGDENFHRKLIKK
jgi:hypothetical protein